MSWLKNKLTKLFTKDDEYDDYNGDNEYVDEIAGGQEPQHEKQERKTSFRFPLIADEEVSGKPVVGEKPSTYEEAPYRAAQTENRPFELPRHLQQQQPTQVYDVEVSGIRELLERRQRGRGQSNVIRSGQEREREKLVTREERTILTGKPVRQERPVDQKITNPLENRKRFVPTDVPSPVHGFKQVTPIEELLKEKQGGGSNNAVKQEKPSEPPAPKMVSKEVATPAQKIEQVKKAVIVQETEQEKEVRLVQEVKNTPIQQVEKQAVEASQATVEPKVVTPILEPVIEELVEDAKQNEIVVSPTPLIVEPVIVEEAASQPEASQVAVATLEKEAEVELPPIRLTLEEEAALEKTVQEEAKPEPVQVQHVTIENSTIHIEQLHVDQMPQADVVQLATPAPTEENEHKEERVETERPSEGTRLPFNVLMLKSDKQKLLAQQLAKEQFRRARPTKEVAAKVEIPVEAVVEVKAETVDIHVENIVVPTDEAEKQSEVVMPAQQHVAESLQQAVTFVPQHVEGTFVNPDTATVGIVQEKDRKLEDYVREPLQVEKVITNLQENTAHDVQPEAVVEVSEAEEIQEQSQLAVEQQAPSEQLAFVDEDVRALAPVEAEVMPVTPQEVAPIQDAQLVEEALITPQPIQEVPVVEVTSVVPEKKIQPYHKPPMDFLLPPEEELEDREWMEEQGEHLIEALSHFQITAQIESIVQGPAVTQFEITVGHGTKVSKVRNLSDDIKLALAAKDVRIDAPIPGKRSIGIEIPNRISRAVRLSEVTNSADFQDSDSPLEAALGLDLTGKPVTLDLRKMPHGLVAGATGSGKSVCINSILVSLLYKADPSELKLLLIDPKMVELAPFNHIPHLVSPVITDVKAATVALKWAVEEMERRYQLFMHSGQRHITGYNKLCNQNKQYAQKLPYILIVIDELADLMMMAPQDVEDAICRIAQKARACGIHLIIATQRPSVDVITGLIKSNIPTRIAFAVSSQIDSRTILDGVGAERLLGRGDMLYMGNGMSAPVRIQGTFVTDEEIEEIIEYVRDQGEPDYLFQQDELLKKAEAVEEQDELFEEVCRYVYEHGSASTSSIQRRYHIGYNRAARLVDMLERNGFVSEQKGSKPRDVYITETDLAHHFGG